MIAIGATGKNGPGVWTVLVNPEDTTVLNLVVASGRVKSPALRFDNQARPEYRFTLEQVEVSADGRTFTLYLPCCASGAAAERLHEQLDEGLHIALTSAKLCYRKRQTQKSGEQSRLEILVWQVEVLSGSTGADTPPHDVDDSVSVDDTCNLEAASVPEPKKARQPRIPKASRLTWQPEHAN